MLRIFRANSVYNFILLPIIGALLLIKSYLDTKGMFAGDYSFITPAFPEIDLSAVRYETLIALSFLSVIFICFQLLITNARFAFIKERTFLPSYLFLFIIYTIPELHFFNPVLISGIFCLLAINSIFDSFEKNKAIMNAFNAGFLTGIAGLFYLSSNLLVFLIPISLFNLRGKVTWREVATPFIGLILPWLFVFTFYFVSNNTSIFTDNIINYIKFKNESLIGDYTLIGYLGLIGLITLISSIFVLKQYDEEKIRVRRYFKILFFFFFSSLIFLIFPFVSYELIVLAALPISFFITSYLSFMHRRFWSEFFFILIFVLSFALQFVFEWMRAG
ncbi:MAG: hypothetical protein KA807_13410 [Prolixibacteraceae bacterium]|nr:hypothetical protein [Prolixibacteraceae bacterium]